MVLHQLKITRDRLGPPDQVLANQQPLGIVLKSTEKNNSIMKLKSIIWQRPLPGRFVAACAASLMLATCAASADDTNAPAGTNAPAAATPASTSNNDPVGGAT